MADKIRNSYPDPGGARLTVVTTCRAEDSYLAGHLHTRKGWHWWWCAISPNGEQLVSTTKGPFVNEHDALVDAQAHGAKVSA